MPLTVKLLVHNPQGGEEIAEEEEEEGEATHKHLPLLALRVPGQVEQRQCVKKLPEVSKEKKGSRKVRPRHIQDWKPSTVRSMVCRSPSARRR